MNIQDLKHKTKIKQNKANSKKVKKKNQEKEIFTNASKIGS